MSGCVPSPHLSIGNDRLEKDRLVILNEGDQIDVPLHGNDEYPLSRVSRRIMMLDRVEQVALSNVVDDLLRT